MTQAKTGFNIPFKQHELKCWPAYFSQVKEGKKRFELRLDDRGFEVGDTIVLREWHLGEYTGHTCQAKILYILKLKEYADIKGWAWKLCRKLMPNLVILSIEVVAADSPITLKNHHLSTLIDVTLEHTIKSTAQTYEVAEHDLQRWLDGYYDLTKTDIDAIFKLLAKHVRGVNSESGRLLIERDLLQLRLTEIMKIAANTKPRN